VPLTGGYRFLRARSFQGSRDARVARGAARERLLCRVFRHLTTVGGSTGPTILLAADSQGVALPRVRVREREREGGRGGGGRERGQRTRETVSRN